MRSFGHIVPYGVAENAFFRLQSRVPSSLFPNIARFFSSVVQKLDVISRISFLRCIHHTRDSPKTEDLSFIRVPALTRRYASELSTVPIVLIFWRARVAHLSIATVLEATISGNWLSGNKPSQ